MMFFKYKRKFNILNPEYASARERDNYSIFNNKEGVHFFEHLNNCYRGAGVRLKKWMILQLRKRTLCIDI